MLLALGFVFGPPALGCAGRAPREPDQVLMAYAEALRDGRAHDAYSLLSDEAKKTITFEEFNKILQENPSEVEEIAKGLTRPTTGTQVTATVTTPDGETLLLVYEGSQWKIDGSALDLYSQATPLSAIHAFILAFENGRYDVLMHFVPDEKLEGLSEKKLKKAWEGEQREEMVALVQALKAALPTARFELLGDRATLAYGAGGTVALVRQHGDWKLEELK